MGVINNRVTIREGGEIKNEYSVSPFDDEFFVQHKWDDYGTLCGEAKKLADTYSKERKLNNSINSIGMCWGKGSDGLEDMQRFIENFKDYKNLETSAGKHVNLVADLGDRWKRFSIWIGWTVIPRFDPCCHSWAESGQHFQSQWAVCWVDQVDWESWCMACLPLFYG